MKKGLMLIFAVALFSSFVFGDLSVESYVVSPSSLRPGSEGSVTITIKNTGTVLSTGTTVSPSGSQFEFKDSTIQVGDVGASSSTTISLPFKVKDDTKTGVYMITLYMRWSGTGSGTTGTSYKTFSVPISVSEEAILIVDSSTVKTVAGKEFPISINISNDGGSAKDLYVSVSSTIFSLDTSKISLGSLGKGKKTNATIMLRVNSSASPGTFKVPATFSYINELGDEKTSTTSFGSIIIDERKAIFLISQDTINFAPGDRTSFQIKIKNVGTSAARNLKITLNSTADYFDVIGSEVKYLDLLKEGEEQTFSFPVQISGSIQSGVYPLIVGVDYGDDYGVAQARYNQQIGLEINEQPKVDFTISSTLSNGNPVVSVSVFNRGNSEIKGVRAEINSTNMEFTNNQQYIGNMNGDEDTSVQFQLLPKVLAGKVHVKVFFEDKFNNERVIEKEKDVIIAANTGLGVLPIIVLIVIAVGVWWRFFRKPNKNNKGAAAKQ